jgi:hypothetical protein
MIHRGPKANTCTGVVNMQRAPYTTRKTRSRLYMSNNSYQATLSMPEGSAESTTWLGIGPWAELNQVIGAKYKSTSNGRLHTVLISAHKWCAYAMAASGNKRRDSPARKNMSHIARRRRFLGTTSKIFVHWRGPDYEFGSHGRSA